MSPLNLQVMVNANSTPSDRLKTSWDAIHGSRYKDRMVMFVGLDLRNVGHRRRLARVHPRLDHLGERRSGVVGIDVGPRRLVLHCGLSGGRTIRNNASH